MKGSWVASCDTDIPITSGPHAFSLFFLFGLKVIRTDWRRTDESLSCNSFCTVNVMEMLHLEESSPCYYRSSVALLSNNSSFSTFKGKLFWCHTYSLGFNHLLIQKMNNSLSITSDHQEQRSETGNWSAVAIGYLLGLGVFLFYKCHMG